MNNSSQFLYQEKITSLKTTFLFVVLANIFMLLAAWRSEIFIDIDTLTVVLLCLSVVFLFYTINYQTLQVFIANDYLKLQFGVFRWTEKLDNIEKAVEDEIPALKKYGGAGIHFMIVHSKYRASFNLLEFPRVCLTLKQKRGFVKELSFTTRHSSKIIKILTELI